MSTKQGPEFSSSSENHADILERLSVRGDSETISSPQPKDNRRNSPLKLIIAMALVAVLSSFGTYWLLGRDTGRTEQEASTSSPDFKTDDSTGSSSSLVTNSIALEAAGFVVARNKASVSSDITGRIRSIDVILGQHVKEGDIIAVLDDREAKIRLAGARLRVDQNKLAAQSANVALELESLRFKQFEILVKQKFVSELSYDQARAELEDAQIQSKSTAVQQADGENSLQAAKIFAERHIIRAPFDGIIVEVTARPGETVSPTSGGNSFIRTGIVQLIDPDSLYVVAEVPERQVVPLQVGQSVEIVSKALGGAVHLSRVDWIAPVSNRQRGIVEVGIELVDPAVRFIDGMEVEVRFLKMKDDSERSNMEQKRNDR
jgi:HlyD family secretion protein